MRPSQCVDASFAYPKPTQELLWEPRRSEHGGPSGRLMHERTQIAAVHGSGQLGVTLIGVVSAKLRSAESKSGRADTTGLEVDQKGANSGMDVGLQQWASTASRQGLPGFVAYAEIRESPTTT
jgi:hypothetical protein